MSDLLNIIAGNIKSGNITELKKNYIIASKQNLNNFNSFYILGIAAYILNNFLDSYSYLSKSISINPKIAETHFYLGNVLKKINKIKEAILSYKKAISINPNIAEVYSNLGNLLQETGEIDDAIAIYKKGISINPNLAEIYYNLANSLKQIKKKNEAIFYYKKAIKLKNNSDFWYGQYFHTKMEACDWDNFSDSLNKIANKICEHKAIIEPLPALGLFDDPALHLIVSKIYTEKKFKKNNIIFKDEQPKSSKKIKIGYFSSDFCNHPIAFLIMELLESHDSSKFEIYGFSFGPKAENDPIRKKILNYFFQHFDLTNIGDDEAVQLIKKCEIDIAINLNGYTQYARNNLFNLRCAPIQVNYLGYPGTMGSQFMDYIFIDNYIATKNDEKYYTEKLIYLPNSYQPNNSKIKFSNKQLTRADFDLPENVFIFCCFNNNYKILPSTFNIWMNILKRVEFSVLWLLEDSPDASKNLKMEAEKRGVNSNRLKFAKRINHDVHLSRHKLANLFLDTFPYNAHTTASDSLCADLPILTMMGKSFASRVATSLLSTLGVNELITTSPEDYENKAVEFAVYPKKLSLLVNKIKNNKFNTFLFDGKKFAKNLEKAFLAIHDRHKAGLTPDHIKIE